MYGGKPRAEPSEGSPLLAGLIVAIVLAVLWVLMVFVTHNGIGLVAWGAGSLIGLAVAKMARPPTAATGTLAALLTVGCVLLAKASVLAFALRPIVQDEILRDPDATRAAFMVDMMTHRSFSPDLQAALDAKRPPGHEPAPPDLSDSPFQRDDLTFRMVHEASARAAAATRAERERLVRAFTEDLVTRMGFWPLLGRLFGVWDLLWLGLGVSTAWKLGQGIG